MLVSLSSPSFRKSYYAKILDHGSQHSFTWERKIPVRAYAGLGCPGAGHRGTVCSLFGSRRSESQQVVYLCCPPPSAHGHSGEMPKRALAGSQSFFGSKNPAGQNRGEAKRNPYRESARDCQDSPAEKKTLTTRQA